MLCSALLRTTLADLIESSEKPQARARARELEELEAMMTPDLRPARNRGLFFLQLCVILEPMQELMSRHKAYALSPRDCLKTTLFQKWQRIIAPPGKRGRQKKCFTGAPTSKIQRPPCRQRESLFAVAERRIRCRRFSSRRDSWFHWFFLDNRKSSNFPPQDPSRRWRIHSLLLTISRVPSQRSKLGAT